MKCTNCGAELPVGSSFCSECGAMISFAAADSGATSYNMDPSYQTGMQSPKKPGGNNLLVIILAGLLLVMTIVLIIVFVGGKDSSNTRDDEREERVNKDEEDEEDDDDKGGESKESEDAIEAAEEVVPEIYDSIMEAFKEGDADIVEDCLEKYYPSEVASIMMKNSEALFDDLDEYDFDDEDLEEIDMEVGVDAGDADELDKDDLEEVVEEVEDKLDVKLDVEWGYKVECDLTAESAGEKETVSGNLYILCVDGKCGVYAMDEGNGKIEVVVDWM